MATWAPVSSEIGLQPITETSTTKKHPLGMKIKAKDISSDTSLGEAEFIYLLGVVSTIATDWVVYDELFATIRGVPSSVGSVAIAMSANVASQYGWYCIYGYAVGGSGAAITIDLPVYWHATAGTVDDADVAGDHILGAWSRSTIAGAAITGIFQLNYPFATDIDYA